MNWIYTRVGFILALILMINDCSSMPESSPPPPAPATSACSGDGCAVMAGVMLLIGEVGAPSRMGQRESNAHTIFGHCEIVYENEAHPTPQPCGNVELTLKSEGVTSTIVRTAWVQGFDFEIPSLNGGPFFLAAYSEEFQARALLHNVKTGQSIRIQIQRARPTPPSKTGLKKNS